MMLRVAAAPPLLMQPLMPLMPPPPLERVEAAASSRKVSALIAPPSPLEAARGSVKLRAAGLAAAADAAQRLCCLIDCVVTPLPLDRGNSRPEAVAGGALDASVPESACGLPRP